MMRLSPFEPSLKNSWPYGAPLYGRPGLRSQYDQFTFEVFPEHPSDDLTECYRVPRNKDEYDPDSIGFDISKANSGTDYVLMISAADRPKLRWYSRRQFEDQFLYDPLDPPRPQGVDPKEWRDQAEDKVKGQIVSTTHLNTDRKTLLNRIAKLWNGQVVCGVHLLADQCPSIKHFSSDLNECTLKRLYYNTNLGRETLLAFGEADWFDSTTGFLKPTNVFRKQSWYDINHKARSLINGRSEFPDLCGDPYEGLTHRLTVGLVRLHDELRGWNGASYYDWEGYTIDAVAKDQRGQRYAREILTEHHNWKLYRKTYRKMQLLHKHGIRPIAVFDSRKTAYMVFNHWHRKGLGELPNGTFNSNYSVSNGRDQIKKAYQSERYDWAIADWTTTWKLKQKTLGPDGPNLSREQIISLNW